MSDFLLQVQSDGGTQSGQTGAFYAISTYIVVKSKTPIDAPVITN
ncbi:hypothetical protein [Seonamhaeicola sp. S2-3]|nr:hypothetical protein [Seonamhaeicola sp. S2-3]